MAVIPLSIEEHVVSDVSDHECECWSYSSPVGLLTITVENKVLVRIVFSNLKTNLKQDASPSICSSSVRLSSRPLSAPLSSHCSAVDAWLRAYFKGDNPSVYSLPLSMSALSGTPFQKEVWQGLLDIPYGTTLSYKGLAESIGRPNAARAIGQTNRVNPLPIVIPCHRVVQASGQLGGYMGQDGSTQLTDIKARLLGLEAAGL